MVYVDNFNAHYRGMIMSHMIADTTEELLEMANSIGVSKKWIQDPGTKWEHFDICQSKKALAIKKGAKLINMRELASISANRTAASLKNPIISPSKTDSE